jgi:acetylornithine deacetylase/succinyl-diaminopimelate desuccinylase-like protein
VATELTDYIIAAVGSIPGVRCEIRQILLTGPVAALPGQDRLVDALTRNGSEIMGEPLQAYGLPIYTDARHYYASGISTVRYGAGPRTMLEASAHGADERLKLSEPQERDRSGGAIDQRFTGGVTLSHGFGHDTARENYRSC